MSLLDGMREKYTTIKRNVKPDGVGGFIHGAIENDKEFYAAISTDLSTEAMIGGAVTTRSNYTFAIPLDISLEHNQLFYRKRDFQYFRVTSYPEDMKPPEYSMMTDYQITAEAVKSPDPAKMVISARGIVQEQ